MFLGEPNLDIFDKKRANVHEKPKFRMFDIEEKPFGIFDKPGKPSGIFDSEEKPENVEEIFESE